jgi:Protein of unknown function (DUF4232)/Ricin-type beta-trefoil lectin domain
MISRSAAVLAAAACLALLAVGCGGNGHTTSGPSGARSSATGTTTTAPASTPTTPVPSITPTTTAPGATPPSMTPPAVQASPRCHTSQLTLAFTGLNAAMGGVRGMTLILTNHSGATCHVYGYPGLAFFNGGGFSMATHLTWMKEPHAMVVLRPGGNAQAMLTWRVNVEGSTPFNPDVAHITPPDEYAYLWANWQGGPVLGGNITAWPLRVAPAGPFTAGTGTIASPFNGMCVAVAADGASVVAWKCSPGASTQHWTGYSDGTLRNGGRCLDVTGPAAGAKVKVRACTGAASQKWNIAQVSANDFGSISNASTRTVLTDPGGSTANGTPLVMEPGRGDLSYPWRVSYYHYMSG